MTAFVIGCGGPQPTPTPNPTADLCHVDTDCKASRVCGPTGNCMDAVPPTPAAVYEVKLEVALVGLHEAMFYVSASQPGLLYDLVVKDIDGQQVARASGMLIEDQIVPVSSSGLKPATDYLAIIFAKWPNGQSVYDHAIFTTKADKQSTNDPPMFKGEPVAQQITTSTFEKIDVLFSWVFTKSGRIYISSKIYLDDAWMVDYIGPRSSAGSLLAEYPRDGKPGSRWFLLQARDDADQITDSRILVINHP